MEHKIYNLLRISLPILNVEHKSKESEDVEGTRKIALETCVEINNYYSIFSLKIFTIRKYQCCSEISVSVIFQDFFGFLTFRFKELVRV